MKELHLQSHVIHRPCGHVTTQRLYTSYFTRPGDPKLSRVVTQDEETLPTKSRYTSIKWSRDQIKNILSSLLQGTRSANLARGNWSEKTPPNMSFDTSITLSRDNYPVGSPHLFQFLLKLSPKNRQISNDYDNTENVQLA